MDSRVFLAVPAGCEELRSDKLGRTRKCVRRAPNRHRILGLDEESKHESYMVSKQSYPKRRPTQAVILAGGRGTRLKPLTDTRPKPMIEVLGKPFLAYQIEQLRDQGFKKILLLLGYLPEVVQEYCGN